MRKAWMPQNGRRRSSIPKLSVGAKPTKLILPRPSLATRAQRFLLLGFPSLLPALEALSRYGVNQYKGTPSGRMEFPTGSTNSSNLDLFASDIGCIEKGPCP
jgi:hypothetical protein